MSKKYFLQLNDSKSEVIISNPRGSSHGSINKLFSSFAQLSRLTKIRSFLSSADLEIVIHAFVSSRLDYCNAFYSGSSRCNAHRLQLTQNAAAEAFKVRKEN